MKLAIKTGSRLFSMKGCFINNSVWMPTFSFRAIDSSLIFCDLNSLTWSLRDWFVLINLSTNGWKGDNAQKVAPKIVSGRVVKILNFSSFNLVSPEWFYYFDLRISKNWRYWKLFRSFAFSFFFYFKTL